MKSIDNCTIICPFSNWYTPLYWHSTNFHRGCYYQLYQNRLIVLRRCWANASSVRSRIHKELSNSLYISIIHNHQCNIYVDYANHLTLNEIMPNWINCQVWIRKPKQLLWKSIKRWSKHWIHHVFPSLHIFDSNS